MSVNTSTTDETVVAAADIQQQSAAHQQQQQQNASSNDSDESSIIIQNKENDAQPAQMAGTTCMELALEGERLSKAGELKSAIRYFEEALKVGTQDERMLSAIYSQLGNAYFFLEDYQRALMYHKQDVKLLHHIGDEAAEAKACGNLGNTFKMLARFDDAAAHIRTYLEISRKLGDQYGEARAAYNLGNVYHTQGKRLISSCSSNSSASSSSSDQEPGELSTEVKQTLQRAIDYYEMSVGVVSKLQDYASMGRAYGNLGNTHYLLGNFELAVENHKKRLEMARHTQDKSAEKRAHLNLGNANVFLGNFREAIENYTATLRLAQELQDKSTEALSCHNLANTYTLSRDYESAIAYHLKYLDMITENFQDDKLGEGRACWSLVNNYQMVNDTESALKYARRHMDIAEQLNDQAGLASAKQNIEELEEIIAQRRQAPRGSTSSQQQQQHQHLLHQRHSEPQQQMQPSHRKHPQAETLNAFRLTPDKRLEQEQRRFKKQLAGDVDGLLAKRKEARAGPVRSSSNERLFEMIAHFQSGRIDDQRCDILARPVSKTTQIKTRISTQPATQIIDDYNQHYDKENVAEASAAQAASADTAEQQQQQQQQSAADSPQSRTGAAAAAHRGSRASQASINPLNAMSVAASAIRATYRKASLVAYPTPSALAQSIQSQRRPTVSAEHRDQLFDMIAGAQNQRMDEQRASLPALQMANGSLRNPANGNMLARGYTTAGSRPPQQAGPCAAAASNLPAPSSSSSSTSPLRQNVAQSGASLPPRRPPQLQRRFQTLDATDAPAPVHDEKFLDSLMKYQSTRFNDQRSEFPKKSQGQSVTTTASAAAATTQQQQLPHQQKPAAQDDNFFNLLVRFQSDRIDNQRSTPPAATRNKQ